MPGPRFLERDTVTLRPIEREDIEFLHRVMNDPRVWRPALDIDPMNYEQGSEFFETEDDVVQRRCSSSWTSPTRRRMRAYPCRQTNQ